MDAAGMCFQSRTSLSPGSRIVIKMMNYCLILEAQVAWCRETGDGNSGFFILGVRYDP